MHAVYLVSLIGGLVTTVLLATLGMLGSHGGHLHLGHSDASGHLPAPHLPHAHAAAGHAHTTTVHAGHDQIMAHAPATQGPSLPTWLTAGLAWALSWLSPLNLAGAALWFGGIGLLAEMFLPFSWLALPFAIAGGLFGALLLRALMAAFVRSSVAPLRADSIGAVATVNAAIRADGVGEVIYTLEGLHRSSPARSEDGTSIPRGTTVVILRRENGVACVQPLNPLEGIAPDPLAPSIGAPGQGDPP
jgi:membrane protein implicated in regulation of membrane protease activity